MIIKDRCAMCGHIIYIDDEDEFEGNALCDECEEEQYPEYGMEMW